MAPSKDQLKFAAQRLEKRLGYLKDSPHRNSRTEANALRIAIDALLASAADQTTGDPNDCKSANRNT